MIILLSLIQDLLLNFPGFNQLIDIANISKNLDLKYVFMAEAQRKHFANSSLSGLRRDIFIDASNHDRVQLYELIHYLLVRLELKLTHFLAKVKQKVVRYQRTNESENQRCNICVLVVESVGQRNLCHVALLRVLH